ncbi:MAG: polysaccharide biosynthesis/export family protein [Bryobacteraceae bacterium]
MNRPLILAACVLAAASMAADQPAAKPVAKSTTVPPATASVVAPPMSNEQARDVVIGPEDTISIVALDAEEISKTWRVSSVGELNLPMIGRIKAGGMSVRQLENEIVLRMKKYLHNPQVTVFVSEFRSQPVNVTGAVAHPGIVQLAGPKSLLDVLVMAGGPIKESGPIVTVTRPIASAGEIPLKQARKDSTGKFSVAELNLKEVMAGESTGSTLVITPHDVVSVGEAAQPRMVHITGDVGKPGAIELTTRDSISLVRAMAFAGGVTRTAKPANTVVMHVNPDGTRTSIAKIDLKRVLAGKAQDIELVAGDIVVIPSSVLGTYLQTAAGSAITTGIWVLARY